MYRQLFGEVTAVWKKSGICVSRTKEWDRSPKKSLKTQSPQMWEKHRCIPLLFCSFCSFSRCQSSEHFLLSQPALMVNTPTILSSHFKPSFPQPLWVLIEAADALFSLIVPQLLPVRPSTAPIMSLVSWETLRLKCQRCSYSHRHSITRYPWLVSFFLCIVCFLFKNTNTRKSIRKLILI